MVQYNINRCVNNVHEIRGEINDVIVANEEKRCDQREVDLQRIADRYDPLFSRLSSLEARAAMYGAIAGIVASGLFGVIWTLVVK
jgi:hypothetical protein